VSRRPCHAGSVAYDFANRPVEQGPPIPLYEPLEDGTKDNIFISKSYDPSSHFEATTDDVRDIYRRCAGEELVVEGLREGIQMNEE